MRRIISVMIILFGVLTLSAQERYFDERYISSLSFLNPVLINPGATGKDGHNLLLNYKNTWASFEDSPKSVILSYDGPVADRLGLGAMLITDANGDLRTTKAQGTVSYTIDAPVNVIGFGIGAEYIKHSLSNDAINTTIDVNDPLIIQRLAGTSFFDVSFGVYGTYDNRFIYGLAFPSLVSTRIDDSNSDTEREIGYIFNLGYRLENPGSDVVLEPSVFVKKLNQVPFHADINLLGRFLDDKLRGGVTYTIGADEKIGFVVGTEIGHLNFTYAYNASRHEFQNSNNGSHELSVRIEIGEGNGDAEDKLNK